VLVPVPAGACCAAPAPATTATSNAANAVLRAKYFTGPSSSDHGAVLALPLHLHAGGNRLGQRMILKPVGAGGAALALTILSTAPRV
jgi:hypothetical protein